VDKLDDILRGVAALKPPAHLRPPPVSQSAWEEAVGSRIARRTQPLRLVRGTLHVRVANAAWANELSLLSADILGQLAARGLSVRELRFTVGSIARRHSARVPGPVRRAAPADAPLPPTLRRAITAIDDSELSQALAGAAARGLALNDDKR